MLPAEEGATFNCLTASQLDVAPAIGLEPLNSSVLCALGRFRVPEEARGSIPRGAAP
jgi:hypothetical protein